MSKQKDGLFYDIIKVSNNYMIQSYEITTLQILIKLLKYHYEKVCYKINEKVTFCTK